VDTWPSDGDVNQHIPGAETATSHLVQTAMLLDLGMVDSGRRKLIAEGGHNRVAAGGDTTGAHAHIDYDFLAHADPCRLK
jgi:hypothetical protein